MMPRISVSTGMREPIIAKSLRALRAPGALRDRKRVGQLHAPVLQPLEQQLQRHQLAHRGRRRRRVGVLRPQHLAGFAIHQQRVLGRGLHRGRGAAARRSAITAIATNKSERKRKRRIGRKLLQCCESIDRRRSSRRCCPARQAGPAPHRRRRHRRTGRCAPYREAAPFLSIEEMVRVARAESRSFRRSAFSRSECAGLNIDMRVAAGTGTWSPASRRMTAAGLLGGSHGAGCGWHAGTCGAAAAGDGASSDSDLHAPARPAPAASALRHGRDRRLRCSAARPPADRRAQDRSRAPSPCPCRRSREASRRAPRRR